MEEENPWLDPESGKHKNKKSVKPTIKTEEHAFKKNGDFLNILVEDGIDLDLPKNVENWAIENFDKEWLKEFLSDLKIVKERILTSSSLPNEENMVLLKYMFLLRQGF